MNASVGCLALGTLVLFFVVLTFAYENSKKILALEKKLDEMQSQNDSHSKNLGQSLLSVDNEIARLRRTIDEHEDTIGFLLKDNYELDKCLTHTKKRLDSSGNCSDMTSHLEGIEDALRSLATIRTREYFEALDRAQNASEGQTEAFCEDHVDSCDHDGDEASDLADSSEDETPSYHWIFPSEGYGSIRNYPRIGDRYFVIGYDRKTKEVVSGFGTWTGSTYDMDDGYDIVQVYAIIRTPSASDVMKKVLDIRMRE